nr:group III truncated hemoglobin [Sphingopyxis panaciterrae]
MIPRFYERVRADAEIGPLFNAAVGDWPGHLEKLVAFWSSVMLTSGRYKGNPVVEHLKHKAHITPAMFDRWLAIWAATTGEETPPAAAAALQAKAARIAESLQLALFFRLDDPPGRRTA